MKHQVYLWWGKPVRLEKFVGRVANRDYWYVTPLFGTSRKQMMIVKK